jgi:hypothetical protein
MSTLGSTNLHRILVHITTYDFSTAYCIDIDTNEEYHVALEEANVVSLGILAELSTMAKIASVVWDHPCNA